MKYLIKFAAVVCLSIGYGTAFAHDATEYMRASQEMERLIEQSMERGLMPRLTEKRTADLITALADSQRFLDSEKYQVKDLGSLMGICERANQVVMSYALFGLKEHIDPKETPLQIQLQVKKLLEKNIITFQDELEILQPFQIRCMAKVIPLLSDFIVTLKPNEITDVRRAGLKQVRNGLLDTYLTSLQCINNTALRVSYRMQIVRVLAETSPSFASVLQISERNQIANMTKIMADSAPLSLRKDLEKIIESMSDSNCTDLCKL